jgi:hypothetical protein
VAIMASNAVDEASALIALAAAGQKIVFASIVSAYHEDLRRVCVVVAGDNR